MKFLFEDGSILDDNDDDDDDDLLLFFLLNSWKAIPFFLSYVLL